jgi:hypothetical protein
MMKNKKLKIKLSPEKQMKLAKKNSREDEIRLHGKSINYGKIIQSKKVYNRKKNKAAANEALPYFFI